MQNILSPAVYNTFIKPLEPVDIIGRKLVLKAHSDMGANVLVNKHGEELRDAIKKCELGVSDFRIVVDGSTTFTLDESEDALDAFVPSRSNKGFPFDSFVVGPGNKFV